MNTISEIHVNDSAQSIDTEVNENRLEKPP